MTPNRELMTMRLLQQLREDLAEMREEMRLRFDALAAQLDEAGELQSEANRFEQSIAQTADMIDFCARAKGGQN